MRLLNDNRFKCSLFVLLLAVALLGLRWSWSTLFTTSDPPRPIVNGVLDLRGFDLEKSAPFYLNGQWELYPGKLLTHGELESSQYASRTTEVPGSWGAVSDRYAYGFGTYRLRILTDPLRQPVGVWLQGIQASSEVEMNGVLTSALGKPAESGEAYTPRNVSYTATYSSEGATELELLIRVANFDEPLKGGLTHHLRFGSQAAIDYVRWYSIGFQLVVFIILVLHGLYAFILYLFNPQEQALFITALLTLSVGIAILIGHDNVLMLWLPLNYSWGIKSRLIVLLWQNYFILLVFRRFASASPRSKPLRAYTILLASVTAVAVASPVAFVNAAVDTYVFLVIYMLPFAWFLYTVGTMMFKRQQADPDIVFLLMAAGGITSNLMWSLAETAHDVTTVYYPVDIIVALTGFSTYWFKKYFRNSRANVMLNMQLQRADKLKDQFLANTSHELRTPLHGIMNIAETIVANEQKRLNADSLKSMELLITISRRMSHMLGDLLDVARLREQRIVLQSEAFSIQSVVPGIFGMLEFMVRSKPVRFVMDIDAGAPPVRADEKRVVQILYNLLHNAIKFTEEGTIVVSAKPKGERLFLSVTDTGRGMDEETLARVFLPYEQGDDGAENGSGLGLGLSISKQLAELHGGALTVSSEPGRGSEFQFDLPLAADREALAIPLMLRKDREENYAHTELAAAATIPAAAAIGLAPALQDDLPLLNQSKARILAVDDDPINLSVLVGILSTEPYTVTTASSAGEALELIGERQWDLLVADVMMPHMSGYELAKKVRERYSLSELPIVLLTARTQPADLYAGFAAGANDYVTKPVDAVELKYRIRAWTGLKQSFAERLRMEAAYLQAQIEPHFLFNTLHSIMALSAVDADRMRKMGEAFASFLRISIDFMNTEELVELSHELELVEAYLLIEKERFEERLHIRWEVEADRRCLLPPLTIQPLVENAVKHGLLKQFRGGTVTIRIRQQEGRMTIEVQDDGKGMEEAAIHKAFRPTRRERGGIGLANTNRRLIARYGQGLTIQSRPGEGTIASFVVPAVYNEGESASR